MAAVVVVVVVDVIVAVVVAVVVVVYVVVGTTRSPRASEALRRLNLKFVWLSPFLSAHFYCVKERERGRSMCVYLPLSFPLLYLSVHLSVCFVYPVIMHILLPHFVYLSAAQPALKST